MEKPSQQKTIFVHLYLIKKTKKKVIKPAASDE